MLKTISATAAILAFTASPATEALAGRAHGHGKGHPGYHRGFHVGYNEGYRAGYVQAQSAAVDPAAAFGAAALGAIYGYWSDGYRTYGGDPCYRYNDRDWAFERVC